MPTLRELQRRFAAALFTDAYERCSGDIRAAGGDARARLGIYRDQLHAAFARTLALEEARNGITVNVIEPGDIRDKTATRAQANC